MKRMLSSIARRFSLLGIRGKLLVLYLCIGIMPFALFSVFTYRNATSQLFASETARMQNALKQALFSVDSSFAMYNTASNYLFNEPNVLLALNKEYDRDYYGMHLAYENSIAPIFKPYYSLYEELTSLVIYTSCDLLPFNYYVRPLDEISSEAWFANVVKAFSPQWIKLNKGGSETLFSIRRIGIPQKYPYDNYLYMAIDIQSAFLPLQSIATANYAVLIENERHESVYQYDSTLGVEGGSPLSADGLRAQNSAAHPLITATLPSTGWTAYYLSDINAIFQGASTLTNTTYVGIWCIMLVLGLLATLLLYILIQPIEMLTKNIRQIAQGNMEITVHSNRKDEVGVLIASFTEMIERIQQLIEVTYKNELEKNEYKQRLLSAQINPHFLYNSLSLINSKAILSGRTDISETAILLSRFYRTALNRGNDLTQLENELNNIKAYVRLQQLLCSMGFEVLYRVDETLMQVLIPNFILQPIVENAIEHGLKNSRKANRILTICVSRREDMLALCVEDNGVGMDQ
ncbi:MAG: histidine kinase, partial [Clostridia bacterium]